MRSKPKTIRFWYWINDGPVRIKLKPGQSLEWNRFEKTDEGFSRFGEVWEASNNNVNVVGWHEGRDCDGYVSGSNESNCPLELLDEGHQGEEIFQGRHIIYPKWQNQNSQQRDLAAENAGY